MKALKIDSLKMFVSFLFIVFLQLNAHAHLNGSCTNQSENLIKVKLTAQQPKIDMQTAIVSGNLEAMRQHIEAGTDIDMIDPTSGSTPLITAATFGRTKIAKALIDANADLDIKNSEGSTALHAAAFFCRVEIVQMLIDAGANKSIRNNHRATPRESVVGPFAEMKPIYELILQQLEPLGLKLDMKEIEMTRPVIAMMLQ